MALIDLSQHTSRHELFEALPKTQLQRPVCLFRFEHRLHDEEHNLWKLELLEELIYGRNTAVVVLSQVVPVWYLLDREPPPCPPAQEMAADPEKAAKAAALREEQVEKAREEVRSRWRKLLRKFTLSISDLSADPSGFETQLERLRKAGMVRFLERVKRECGSIQVQEIATDMLRVWSPRRDRQGGSDTHLDPAEIDHAWVSEWDGFVDELRQRAEPHYQMLWTLCSEREKIVLVHLAEGGLVNARNERALKRLLARGLVVRLPHFRLMNESFQRFVSTSLCCEEVRALEQVAEASTWTKIRAPLVTVLIGAAGFLFITQREVFDTSVAFVGAIAAALPALFRMIGLGGSSSPPQIKGAS